MYILVLLAISTGLSVLLFFLGYFLMFKVAYEDKLMGYECGFDPFGNARGEFDIRFYLVAILFLIFDLEITFLFPFSVSIMSMTLLSYSLISYFCIIITDSKIDNVVIIIRILYILLYLHMPLYLVFVSLSGTYASAYLQFKYMTKAKLKSLLLLPNTWLMILKLIISIILVVVFYKNQLWISEAMTNYFNEFREARLAQYKLYTVVDNTETDLKKGAEKYEPKRPKKKFYYSPYFSDFGALISQKSVEIIQNKESQESPSRLPRILNRIAKALTYGKQNRTISDFTQKTYGSVAQLSWYTKPYMIKGVFIGKAYLGFSAGNQTIFEYLRYPTKIRPSQLQYQNDFGTVILPSFKGASLKGVQPIIYDDIPGTSYKYQRCMKGFLKRRDHSIDTTIQNPLLDGDKEIIQTIVNRQLANLSLVKFGPSDIVEHIGQEVVHNYRAMWQQTMTHFFMRPGREEELNLELTKYVFALANYTYGVELMTKDYPATVEGAIKYGTGYALKLFYIDELKRIERFHTEVAADFPQYVGAPYIQPGIPGVRTPEQFIAAVNDFKTDFYNTPDGPAIYDYCYFAWENDFSDWQPFLARIDAMPIPCFQKFERKVELLKWKQHMLLNRPESRLINIPTIYTGVEQFIEKYERAMAQVRLQEVYIAEYIRLVLPQTHQDTKLLIQKYSNYSVAELKDLVTTEQKKRNDQIYAQYVAQHLFQNQLSFSRNQQEIIANQLLLDDPYLVQYQTQVLLEAAPEGIAPFSTLELLVEEIIDEGHMGGYSINTNPIAVEYVPVVKGNLTATDKIGQMNYNIAYNYDPFDMRSKYDYILKYWFNFMPEQREILQKALDEKLKTCPDYKSWIEHCHTRYFQNDDPSVIIPPTAIFMVHGQPFLHGLTPEEMRLFHCSQDFPIAMHPETGAFSWHPYLKLRPERLEHLKQLGWDQYVHDEIKSHIIESWNTDIDFDYENWTTRRIMVHNKRYTLINNHYLPLHYTMEIPLGEYEGQQLVFSPQLSSEEFEWYRNYPLEFPIRFHSETNTYSWHEVLTPTRILTLQDAAWPAFLAKQFGYPDGTRLVISDTQVNLKQEKHKELYKVKMTFKTEYPNEPLKFMDTHPNTVILQRLLDELWMEPTTPRPRPLEDLCKEIDGVLKNFSWTEAPLIKLDLTQEYQTFTQASTSQPNVQANSQQTVQL
ncbi:hypothetical protein ACTA71_004080 [Dictyostelium dimigraforme]